MKFFKPKFWDKNQISIFSILLFPIALIVKLINYSKIFVTKKYKCPIPVICVGNIYLGGTGKTPFCIELLSILQNLNKKSVFIRKKYNSFQDEINLLKLSGPVYEEEKRINALNNAVKDGAEVAILDDGFQDFSIKEKYSIVCFNEKQWIGNGFIIPAGPLRESLSALNRAKCVIINGKKNLDIEKKITEKNNEIKIFYTKYEGKNLNDFKNNKVVAFAGIGNPNNFFDLLKDNSINLQEEIIFPDHYNYSNEELENLINKGNLQNAILLTTEKDFLRIGDNYKKNIKYLKISVIIENRNQFIEEIKKIL